MATKLAPGLYIERRKIQHGTIIRFTIKKVRSLNFWTVTSTILCCVHNVQQDGSLSKNFWTKKKALQAINNHMTQGRYEWRDGMWAYIPQEEANPS